MGSMKNAILRFLRSEAIIAGALSAILYIGIVFSFNEPTFVEQSRGGATVGQIYQSTTVKQTFNSNGNISSFKILFATYGRTNEGTVTVTLTNSNNDVIEAWEFGADTLLDNAYKEFEVSKKTQSDEYTLSITSTGDIDNSITIWCSPDESYNKGAFFINDVKADGDIVFSFSYTENFGTMLLQSLLIAIILFLLLSVSISFIMGKHIKKLKEMSSLNRKNVALSIVFTLVIAFFTALLIYFLYNIYDGESVVRLTPMAWVRIEVLTFGIFIALCHLTFDITKMYNFVIRYRYVFVGIIVVIWVLNKFNYSSIGMWNFYVSSDGFSEFESPVIGSPRAIRSDEWLVGVPNQMSGKFGDTPYAKYNSVVNSGDLLNISTSGIYMSYSIFQRLHTIGFFFLPEEYAFSFSHIYKILFAILPIFEFLYIITKKNSVLSVLGTALISFSSFTFWWSISQHFGSVFIVFIGAYYFVNSATIKKKSLSAFLVALGGIIFITTFYPAWTVPLAYLLIALFVYLFIDNWKKIKKFSKIDYIIIICAFLFMASVVVYNIFIERAEYSAAQLETVYPGKRFSTGGGSINYLFDNMQTFLFPFRDYGNPSEGGRFISFFPIPTILSLYIWFKNKKENLLILLLNIASLMWFVYAVVGVPAFIAKYTLMSYTTADRLGQIFGLIQVILLIIVIQKNDELPKKKWLGLIGAVVCVVPTLYYSYNAKPAYMPIKYIVFIVCVFAVCSFVFSVKMSKSILKIVSIGLISMSLVTSLAVNPLMVGLDAVKAKPLSREISRISSENPDGIWIYNGTLATSIVSASGGNCLNTVNMVPNMKLWKPLFGDEKAEIYNRYAHVIINLTDEESDLELVQADCVKLTLSYDDLEKLNINYICSNTPLETNKVGLTRINEIGSEYIYEVLYN